MISESVAHEILTCVKEGVGLSERDYQCDLANGSECKSSFSLQEKVGKNGKKEYMWIVRDLKNKTGPIHFIAYHKGVVFNALFPPSAYKNQDRMFINTDEDGNPLKTGKYYEYFY